MTSSIKGEGCLLKDYLTSKAYLVKVMSKGEGVKNIISFFMNGTIR